MSYAAIYTIDNGRTVAHQFEYRRVLMVAGQPMRMQERLADKSWADLPKASDLSILDLLRLVNQRINGA